MKQLREVEEKFHSINILLERNRAARHKKNTTIAFPFVGLILDSDEQEVIMFLFSKLSIVHSKNSK